MALLAVVTALAQTGFAFGRTGGNIMPFSIAIAANGHVIATGAAPAHTTTISKVRLATLERAAVNAKLQTMPAMTSCPGTLPDIAAQYIRVERRTVRVHGACIARFNRLWAVLNRSVRP